MMKKIIDLVTSLKLTIICLVAAMILIVAGLSLPSIAGIMDHARLTSAAAQLASFYQQSRIRATQDNNYYEVLLSSPGTNPVQACLDLNGDGAGRVHAG